LTQLDLDMRETMVGHNGVGLAAPQVGKSLRMVIVDLSTEEEPNGTRIVTLVNPEVLEFRGRQSFEEGCLSITNLKANVNRAKAVKVKALDIHGQPLSLELEGYKAVVIQHELDHLDGILFIDHLSNLARQIYDKRLKKSIKDKKEQEEKDERSKTEQAKRSNLSILKRR
jgi:peptide deformylase